MSIFKGTYCEVEIQEQTDPDAGAKFMVVLSYQPENQMTKEIISVVLTNKPPFLRHTKDLGDKIVNAKDN